MRGGLIAEHGPQTDKARTPLQCGQKMPNTLILNYIVGLPKELLSPDLDPMGKVAENDEALLHFACGLVVWNKVML